MNAIKINQSVGFQTISNILSKEDISHYKKYFELQFLNSHLYLENDKKTITMNSLGCYADIVGESLLLDLLPVVEKATGKQLFPTCSYQRMYLKGALLKKHKDRAACEISCTLTIDHDASDTSWPIFIELDGNSVPIHLDRGEALIYRGCETKHWRETFKGNYSNHLFLHYVEKNGPRSAFKYDKRLSIFGKNDFRKVLKSRIFTLEHLDQLSYDTTLYQMVKMPIPITEMKDMMLLPKNILDEIEFPLSKTSFLKEIFSQSNSFSLSLLKSIEKGDTEVLILMKKLILLGYFGLLI